MLVETYLEEKFVKERNIDLHTFEDRLNNFKEEGAFTQVKICLISSIKGVSITTTNRVSIDNFKLYRYNDNLLLEFEKFKNAISINEDANVCLDLLNSRILFRDLAMSVYFC